jgi:hypothetical protein
LAFGLADCILARIDLSAHAIRSMRLRRGVKPILAGRRHEEPDE